MLADSSKCFQLASIFQQMFVSACIFRHMLEDSNICKQIPAYVSIFQQMQADVNKTHLDKKYIIRLIFYINYTNVNICLHMKSFVFIFQHLQTYARICWKMSAYAPDIRYSIYDIYYIIYYYI